MLYTTQERLCSYAIAYCDALNGACATENSAQCRLVACKTLVHNALSLLVDPRKILGL